MAQVTETDRWQDHMPAIVLRPGVPVNGPLLAFALYSDTTNDELTLADPKTHEVFVVTHLGWLVDLDDPQGFGYALRWLTIKTVGTMAWANQNPGATMAWRHLTGTTTDADRLALAKACKAVS